MRLQDRDLSILKLLNENARIPDAAIAKKLKISKQAVGYRIRKLEKQGVIKGFYAEYDVSKLGFDSFYLFLTLENIDGAHEQQLIKKLVKEENVGWVISCLGTPNIIILAFAKTLKDFDSLLHRIKRTCSRHMRDISFAALVQSQKLSYRFLESGFKSIHREKTGQVLLDKLDKALLISLAHAPRETTVNLARNINASYSVITYRRKRLEGDIIKGYHIKLDISKLDIQWYILLLKLPPFSDETVKKLITYVTEQKQTYYATSIVGSYDLMIDLHVKNTEELSDFILKLRERFAIQHFSLLLIYKEHKFSYLPGL